MKMFTFGHALEDAVHTFRFGPKPKTSTKKQKHARHARVSGIDTLDSDLMNFKRNPISWRAEIGGAHLMGEASEESMKGV
jgi:hypothetical protein